MTFQDYRRNYFMVQTTSYSIGSYPARGRAAAHSTTGCYFFQPYDHTLHIRTTGLVSSFHGKIPAASVSTCQPDQEMLEAVVFHHASFTLIRDDAAQESYMPFIRISDFQGSMIKSVYLFLDEELLKMQPDTHLTYGVKFINGTASSRIYMLSNFPVAAGSSSMCAQPTDNVKLKPYGFYNLPGDSVPPSTLTFSQRYPDVTQAIRWLYAAGLGLLLLLLAIDLFAPFRRKPVTIGS
jgi:hypothetical protein